MDDDGIVPMGAQLAADRFERLRVGSKKYGFLPRAGEIDKTLGRVLDFCVPAKIGTGTSVGVLGAVSGKFDGRDSREHGYEIEAC